MGAYSQHANPGACTVDRSRHRCGVLGLRKGVSNSQPVLVLATHSCHTQMFWLSLCWGFSVYYFCVSQQRRSCQMVMGCQVRLLPVWCEETGTDGRCHFLGSDVHTSHQRLMLLHWACLPIGTGLNVLERHGGNSFQGLKLRDHASLCWLQPWPENGRKGFIILWPRPTRVVYIPCLSSLQWPRGWFLVWADLIQNSESAPYCHNQVIYTLWTIIS